MRIPGFSATTVGFLLAIFGSLAPLAGCAAQSPAHEKRLAEMRDKITILQNERDRLDERLTAVEARQMELGTELQAKPQRESRPPLKVVVLKPEEREGAIEEAATEAESGAPPKEAAPARTLISGQGQQIGSTEPGETP